MPLTELEPLLAPVRALAKAAGEAILQHYDGSVAVRHKADQSPVTDADLASDLIIRDGLAHITPGIRVITEETFDGVFTVPDGQPFWLVDPLDGTKEFIAQSGEFTVNIGLIGPERLPVLGVMYAPVFDECLSGIVGQSAWMEDKSGERPITTRMPPPEGLTAIGSRYHGDKARMDEFLSHYKIAKRYVRGSTYKFCEVCRGDVDLYPHFGNTYEWDTAAGHAVLLAAGGNIHTAEGGEFTYGKPGLRNPAYIVKGAEFKELT